jgi:DtxR family Mn-dependent transcriptional regulator
MGIYGGKQMISFIDISASMQDYLEVILDLENKEEAVRVTDIANKLNIAKASVNQTVKKLKNMCLVQHQTYGPVELTSTGKKIALKVRQRHELIKEFLIEVLGVQPSIAEEDACLMEHIVSRQTMEKLYAFLFDNGYIDKEISLEDDYKENK